MSIIGGITLESNKNIHLNFEGGNLSSDAGLLLIREFIHKLGVDRLAKEIFHTTDPVRIRQHKDHENLLQMLFQIMAAYFQDDQADALRNDSSLTAAVGKETLASRPTLSRFHNTLRLKLIKIAARIVRSARYVVFKLCSSCPFQNEFYETLHNIRRLQPLLE